MKLRKSKDRVFQCKDPKDYEVFSLAIPHHDEFQRKTAEVVSQNIGKPDAGSGRECALCEIGPGTGVTLSFLLQQTNNLQGINYLDAVDNSSEMIRILKSNYADPRIRIIEADILDFLGSCTEYYDGIYSAYTIHNLEQEMQKEIFRGVFKSLKSGGCFVDGDIFAYADKEAQKRVFEWQIGMYEKHVPSPQKEEWIAHVLADSRIYFVLKEAVAILRRIGFEVEVVFREKLEAVILARKP